MTKQALVRCRDCEFFTPDQVNPPAGLGDCWMDAARHGLAWPNLARECPVFRVSDDALLTRCKRACAETALDPQGLFSWIRDQADPGLTEQQAVTRIAQILNQEKQHART